MDVKNEAAIIEEAKHVDQRQNEPAMLSAAKSGWFVPASSSDPQSNPSQLAISTQESSALSATSKTARRHQHNFSVMNQAQQQVSLTMKLQQIRQYRQRRN